ncbi:hypothetical protein [Frigoriglobus tundricola]|uniref:Uncharacterized protein n=1 Tax=Frigoriglobus tundricola TaxID=2774151 RepID=A0A6M5YL20_9BACT|nr:hypothetical protein [Frigoriglobus tundricola]QJW94717.1 hypothetical protein FTUN_2239 [Frigoriglobus tundricola]
MTESEWLASGESKPLLEFLMARTSERKLRLFAVDCCRRVKYLLKGSHLKRSRKAIGVVERHVEGLATFEEVRAALDEVLGDCLDASHSIVHAGEANFYAAEYATNAVAYLNGFRIIGTATCTSCALAYDALARDSDPVLARIAAEYAGRGRQAGEAQFAAEEAEVRALPRYVRALVGEQTNQAQLLRDIIGNPFRVAAFSSNWRTGTTVLLARQMHESRDYSAMPVLADALQDCGCDNCDMLDHCRGPGPHVRGCWVVDLVLGKE